jgi:hypothetical protein
MAAGLGFKDFQTGEVLTAADVDGYLMQGIWVFANATARDAAVTSPQEGNFAYLKDTNVTTYYTGSAWANLDTTGMTNPMTTTGDTIYSSSGSTPARLGIGTAGQVLQVNSGATAPEWATPAAAGGMTLINTGGTALTGSSVSITSIPSTYTNLYVVIVNAVNSVNNERLALRVNGDTGSNYFWQSTLTYKDTSVGAQREATSTFINLSYFGTSTDWFRKCNGTFTIPRYAVAESHTVDGNFRAVSDTAVEQYMTKTMGLLDSTSAITNIQIITTSGTFSAGTVYVYGVS